MPLVCWAVLNRMILTMLNTTIWSSNKLRPDKVSTVASYNITWFVTESVFIEGHHRMRRLPYLPMMLGFGFALHCACLQLFLLRHMLLWPHYTIWRPSRAQPFFWWFACLSLSHLQHLQAIPPRVHPNITYLPAWFSTVCLRIGFGAQTLCPHVEQMKPMRIHSKAGSKYPKSWIRSP